MRHLILLGVLLSLVHCSRNTKPLSLTQERDEESLFPPAIPSPSSTQTPTPTPTPSTAPRCRIYTDLLTPAINQQMHITPLVEMGTPASAILKIPGLLTQEIPIGTSTTLTFQGAGTYHLSVEMTDAVGFSGTCYLDVVVQNPNPIPPPSCVVTANPGLVSFGMNTNLSINAQGNYSSIEIYSSDPGQVLPTPGLSFILLSPKVTQTIEVRLIGPGGVGACHTTIAVQLTGYFDLYLTPQNSHLSLSGSFPPICPNGFSPVATFADCGLGTCAGNQLLCAKAQTIAVTESNYQIQELVEDFYIDPLGTRHSHLPGIPMCPTGYEYFGSIADCSGLPSQCSGNQNFCLKRRKISEVGRRLTSIVADLEGVPRIAGGNACPLSSGYVEAGIVKNCGMGICDGEQRVCKK